MKKIVFAVSFFTILLQISVSGQTTFRFGFQTTPTISWLTTNDQAIKSDGVNAGLKVGMLSEFFINENYSIVSGVGLSFNQGGALQHTQGGNFWPNSELSDSKYYVLNDDVTLQYHLQYVEIPISMRMRTKEIGYWRYFAEIPVIEIGVLAQARGTTEGYTGVGGDTEKEFINKDVNPLAINWGFGAGAEYSLTTTTSIIAGIFYRKGIFDVTRNKNAQKFLFDEQGYPIIGEGEAEDSNALLNGINFRIAIMF